MGEADDLLREASDPTTPGERLVEIWNTPRDNYDSLLLSALRRNPSLPVDWLRRWLLGGGGDPWYNPAVPALLMSEPRPEYMASARTALARWALGSYYDAHPNLRDHLTRVSQARDLATAVALLSQLHADQLPSNERDALAFARHLAGLFGLPWPEPADPSSPIEE